MAIVVHLDRPPHAARLVAWGRADDGWWACVTWQQRVRGADGKPREIGFAAWVPATAVKRAPWSGAGAGAGAGAVPRLALPGDRRAWPAPTGGPSWYAGAWPAGPVPVPPGVEVINGPAWRPGRR